MATTKICLVIAMLAVGGFGAMAGAVSNKVAQDPDTNVRLFAMIFVGATIPR